MVGTRGQGGMEKPFPGVRPESLPGPLPLPTPLKRRGPLFAYCNCPGRFRPVRRAGPRITVIPCAVFGGTTGKLGPPIGRLGSNESCVEPPRESSPRSECPPRLLPFLQGRELDAGELDRRVVPG